MRKSIALRLVGALFLLVAVLQNTPSAHACTTPCGIGTFCQSCAGGGARLCTVSSCCGVTRTSCGTCVTNCRSTG